MCCCQLESTHPTYHPFPVKRWAEGIDRVRPQPLYLYTKYFSSRWPPLQVRWYLCVLMMAEPILTRAATAPVTRSFGLAPPPRVYAKDDNCAERGSHLPWQEMQSHEMRHRQRHESADNDDSSVTVGKELTPTSSEDREEREGMKYPWCSRPMEFD